MSLSQNISNALTAIGMDMSSILSTTKTFRTRQQFVDWAATATPGIGMIVKVGEVEFMYRDETDPVFDENKLYRDADRSATFAADYRKVFWDLPRCWTPKEENRCSPQHWKVNVEGRFKNSIPSIMTTALRNAFMYAGDGFMTNDGTSDLSDMQRSSTLVGRRVVDFLGEVITVDEPIVFGDLNSQLASQGAGNYNVWDRVGSGVMNNVDVVNGTLKAREPGVGDTVQLSWDEPLAQINSTSGAPIAGIPSVDPRAVVSGPDAAGGAGTVLYPTATYYGVEEMVPPYLLFVGTYDIYDRDNLQTREARNLGRNYVNNCSFSIDIDVNRVADGGVFLQNVTRSEFNHMHLYNLKYIPRYADAAYNGTGTLPALNPARVNRISGAHGFRTAVSSPALTDRTKLGCANYRAGVNSKTTIDWNHCYISGYHRYSGDAWDAPNQGVSNMTGISLFSADCRINYPVATALWRDLWCDSFNNGQIVSPHFWGGGCDFGETEGIVISDAYFDFGHYRFWGNFNHLLNGMNLRAGSAGIDLIANVANTTGFDDGGSGMTINGVNANNNSAVRYLTQPWQYTNLSPGDSGWCDYAWVYFQPGASWATPSQRGVLQSGYFGEEETEYTEFVPLSYWISNEGTIEERGSINVMAENTYYSPRTASAVSRVSFMRGYELNIDPDANGSGDGSSMFVNVQNVNKLTIDEDTPDGIRFQEYQNDPTPNRAMLVGSAFGLGDNSPVRVGNINTRRETGFYATTSATFGDFPGAQKNGYLIVHGFDANDEMQTYRTVIGHSIFVRHYRSGAWSNWYEFSGTEIVPPP